MNLLLKLLSVALLLSGIMGCSQIKENLSHSEEVISEIREVTEFNQVLFTGNGNLYISQGEENSVTIKGEKTLVDSITTLVVDQVLRIDNKKGKMGQKAAADVHLQVKTIREIRLSGSGSITTATPLNIHQLKISLSGSGSGIIDIAGNKLVTILSGSSNFTVKGTVDNQDIWINGSGIYHAEELSSKVSNINITGSGKVSVNVQDDMDIRITGSGSIIYEGLPRIRQTITGSGSVMRKEESAPTDSK